MWHRRRCSHVVPAKTPTRRCLSECRRLPESARGLRPGSWLPRMSRSAVLADKLGQRSDVYRFGEVTVETSIHEPASIRGHGECRQRHNWNPPGHRIGSQPTQRLDTVEIWKL